MITIVILAVLLVAASVANATIWDIFCNVDYAYEGDEPVTLFNLPGGTGSPFTEARLPDGSVVDATLRVQIIDYMGDPVAYFPAEDLWLESTDGGLVPCPGGVSADMDTDENGWTLWAEPLHAGGHSSAQCTMLINGMYAQGWVDLDLHFNSADITGDGTVNLSDGHTTGAGD